MKTRALLFLFALLFGGGTLLAQTSVPSGAAKPAEPESSAPAARQPVNQAEAYYHFSLGHIYEEMAVTYNRGEYANRAIEEYRQAIRNDPSSAYLNEALAELYFRSGRTRDAVLESQELIKRDPDNIEARRLLGRIYLRTLGDLQNGAQSTEILKRAIEQFEAIVRIAPKEIDDRLLLGRLYKLNNQSQRAEDEFKTAVQLQPYSDEAVSALAYLYNDEGKNEEAFKLLDAIPDKDRSSRLYYALGYTYEKRKDYKRAIDAYRKSIDLDPENLDAMRQLAVNLMNDGQLGEALTLYQRVIAADPQDAESYLRMAEIYRQTGRFDAALEALQKTQNYVEDPTDVQYNMAVIYQNMGRFDEAIQVLEQLVRVDRPAVAGANDNRALFLERLGRIYRDTGKYQQAVETFRKMLNMGEEIASRGYQEIVDTYREGKLWNEATAAAREAVAKVPGDRYLKLTLAAQLSDTGEADQGLATAKALLTGTAEDRDVDISLAQIYSRLRRFPEAEEYIAKAEALSTRPEERQYVWFVWGSVLERQKKYEQAEQMFKKSLEADPRNASTLNYLGYMLADRGVRLQEALGYIKRAVELEPQNGAYLDSLGWAYFKLGDYSLAEDNLRRAAERTSNDPTVQDHLAEVYAHTGRLKLAAAHWERALLEWNRSVPADIDPNDLQRVQKKLDSAKVRLARQQPAKAEAAKP